jgi:hypothetical protein
MMSEAHAREGSWIATRKGKLILVCGIIATIVVAVIVIPVGFAGLIALMDSNKLRAQHGDKVNIVYMGTYASNGTFLDSGTLIDQVIGSNNLISYFDQQLVGMEPGVKKTFVIPAQFGYTNPTDKLYGQDLRFEVTITKLVRDGTLMYPIPT